MELDLRQGADLRGSDSVAMAGRSCVRSKRFRDAVGWVCCHSKFVDDACDETVRSTNGADDSKVINRPKSCGQPKQDHSSSSAGANHGGKTAPTGSTSQELTSRRSLVDELTHPVPGSVPTDAATIARTPDLAPADPLPERDPAEDTAKTDPKGPGTAMSTPASPVDTRPPRRLAPFLVTKQHRRFTESPTRSAATATSAGRLLRRTRRR